MRIPLVSYPAAAWLAYKVVRQLTKCLARVLWRSPRLVSITDLRTLMQVTESASSAAQAARGVHAIILPDQTLDFSCCCLTSMPMELGDLSHLTSLNASHNKLVSLHPHFCSLTSLVTLNLMGNNLTQLPERFGDLKSLRLLGLKSNRLTCLPASFTALTALVELFITDNQLTALPSGFGGLMSLVKLQASFNPLASLPPDMLALPCLELLRVAVCQLPSLPSPLWAQEQQGPPGPAAEPGSSNTQSSSLPRRVGAEGEGEQEGCDWTHGVWVGQGGGARVGRGGLGGSGAGGSGVLRGLRLAWSAASQHDPAGHCHCHCVPPPPYRADVSPDGRTVEEVAIACAVDHPNLTRVQAVVALAPPAPAPAAPPAAAPEPAPMLLMDLVPGQPLAAKPTSQHLLRCKGPSHTHQGPLSHPPGAPLTPTRWRPDTQFSLQQVVAIGTALSSALAYLHARCICHGCPGPDRITLCDFGEHQPPHSSLFSPTLALLSPQACPAAATTLVKVGTRLSTQRHCCLLWRHLSRSQHQQQDEMLSCRSAWLWHHKPWTPLADWASEAIDHDQGPTHFAWTLVMLSVLLCQHHTCTGCTPIGQLEQMRLSARHAFGASFSYKEGEWFWQAMEVRAFGLLMNDVQQRLHPGPQGHASGHAAYAMLAQLVVACQLESPAARPGFQQLHDRFLAMAAS
ncbi:hypothetical protein V8C86DRAFT_2439644 [Haematococcus lacustris]